MHWRLLRRGGIGAVLLVVLLALPAAAIVYGEPDNGRHPFVGSLLYDFDEDGDLDNICTGTLVAPRVLLTASHCTAFLEVLGVGAGQAAVTFDDQLSPDMTVYYGTAHTHPEFSGFRGPGGMSDPHDIAVIVFDAPVPIAPARLPREGLLEELARDRTLRASTFTAVGYGLIRETRRGAFDAIMPSMERRLATQRPLSLTSAWLTLSMNEARGDGGTCYGDSGGPHFLGGPRETDIVVSITVTGDTVCKATDKTYRVDTPSARAFLAEFVSLP